MTYGAVAQSDSATHDETPARHGLPQNLLGGIALAVIVGACGRTLYAHLPGTDHNAIVARPTPQPPRARPPRRDRHRPPPPPPGRARDASRSRGSRADIADETDGAGS